MRFRELEGGGVVGGVFRPDFHVNSRGGVVGGVFRPDFQGSDSQLVYLGI